MNVEAILTPAEIAGLSRRDLSSATCVVFDVLRATSTMVTALAHGARRIYPVSSVEEAHALKVTRLPGALLGGERGGVRIDGFELGNSPREYTVDVIAGRDIISTTTNGTVALRACAGAKEVLAGAWLNLNALDAWLRARKTALSRLVLVCAGTGQRFSLEDGYAAGSLLERLVSSGGGNGLAIAHRDGLDDAAFALLAMYERASSDPLGVLRRSANGRRLAEIGLGADVDYCAATSTLPWVGVMREGALKGESVETGR